MGKDVLSRARPTKRNGKEIPTAGSRKALLVASVLEGGQTVWTTQKTGSKGRGVCGFQSVQIPINCCEVQLTTLGTDSDQSAEQNGWHEGHNYEKEMLLKCGVLAFTEDSNKS